MMSMGRAFGVGVVLLPFLSGLVVAVSWLVRICVRRET